MRKVSPLLAALLLAVPLLAAGEQSSSGAASAPTPSAPEASRMAAPKTVRIAYLHHSTGQAVWDGGVADFIRRWNAERGTSYTITELNYPATLGGAPRLLARVLPFRVLHAVLPHYPWANYPYDYWNLWVAHTGSSRDRGELNLDDLARQYDVIVFKHCFPVSAVEPDGGAASVASQEKTLANYRLQYEALKARLRQFPDHKFIVWTGAALTAEETSADQAARAREFFTWVKERWDEKGDNVFVWDFHQLETEGGLYLKPEHADGPGNSHPNASFSKKVAPLIGRRIVDVIEGRGDLSPITGSDVTAGATPPTEARTVRN